jgi:hypothetical protein
MPEPGNRRLLLGDEADVPRQHYAAAGELPHVADVQRAALEAMATR